MKKEAAQVEDESKGVFMSSSYRSGEDNLVRSRRHAGVRGRPGEPGAAHRELYSGPIAAPLGENIAFCFGLCSYLAPGSDSNGRFS